MSIANVIRAGVLGAAFFAVGTPGRAAEAAPNSDAWITTKTKIALVTENQVSIETLHVDTIDGKLTLYGRATSEIQRQNAGTIAKRIEGVSAVRNLLEVVTPANDHGPDETDERIKMRVERALTGDASLSESSVTVKSVKQGRVLLSGKAASLSDHLRAVESTGAIAGVRSVATEVVSSNEISESASHDPGGIRSAARDSWITTETKLRLFADRNVPALDISVDTYRGKVTLFGIVPSSASRNAAEFDAKQVDSVVSVIDGLEVVPSAYKEWINAKDGTVRRDVKSALSARPELKRIDAEVKDGVAHLTGTVGSVWQRLQAATIARATRGVRSVDDDLHLAHASN